MPRSRPNSSIQRGQSEAPRKSSSIPAKPKWNVVVFWFFFPPFPCIHPKWQHLLIRGIQDLFGSSALQRGKRRKNPCLETFNETWLQLRGCWQLLPRSSEDSGASRVHPTIPCKSGFSPTAAPLCSSTLLFWFFSFFFFKVIVGFRVGFVT